MEAQKRAYLYSQFKEKIAKWCGQKDTSNRHKKNYVKIIENYYSALNIIRLEPTFNKVEESGPYLEYQFPETEYDDMETEDLVPYSDEIVHFDIHEPEKNIAAFTKYDDKAKISAISQISDIGMVIGKDDAIEIKMTNIFIQPIHLLYDQIYICLDFNMTNKDLITQVMNFKKSLISLPEKDKIMPSQLLTRNMLAHDINQTEPINAVIASRIYSANPHEYPRLLLMYDGLLFHLTKSAISTLIAQTLSRKSEGDGIRLSGNTQKFYSDAVKLLTNDLYLSQCVLLLNLKDRNPS